MDRKYITTNPTTDGIEYEVLYPEVQTGIIDHKEFRRFLVKEQIIRDTTDYTPFLTNLGALGEGVYKFLQC